MISLFRRKKPVNVAPVVAVPVRLFQHAERGLFGPPAYLWSRRVAPQIGRERR